MNRKTEILFAGAGVAAGVYIVSRVLGGRRIRLKKSQAGENANTADEAGLSHSSEPVEVTSEDSFPASDPPSWTGTTGAAIQERA